MNNIFISEEKLKMVIMIDKQIEKLLREIDEEANFGDKVELIEALDKLTDVRNEYLNDGKQVKAIDKTAIFTSVLGFISVRQLLKFEETGVITSKVFPSITKWIGK